GTAPRRIRPSQPATAAHRTGVSLPAAPTRSGGRAPHGKRSISVPLAVLL
ncbi:MAG: hypothetical protein AVDCRST_MAG73-2475, partial [uncultured Thermomicrobiales bacterium]